MSDLDCPLCSQIPSQCDMDMWLGEGSYPEVCDQLEGWPSTLCVPLRREVRCQTCDTRYWLEIETGGMEWDLSLRRLGPPASE